ncbi:Vi polysaccharide biosynthesis UDP-N-acetylglucosamine C-6 dehydrogenase TviB [Pseudomonadales bacterium]|nr:Vi polysaccharide biosynthesis UDP-N-acetylglucosamine C-6 dehydrogenase TviB [Pseudomonadales bacterium]
MKLSEIKLAVIGLGYVGLPLAIGFGRVRKVIGYDTNAVRIANLKNAFDETLEVTPEEIDASDLLTYSNDETDLESCNVFIVTVPTPIDMANQPDLKPLVSATKCIGRMLRKGSVVIYESTVYPGCTEEVCVPLLERTSGLIFNHDFFCGYSPERINPGDKSHRIEDVIKVTSGSTPVISDLINSLYCEIILAGTHQAKSIKVAEAAKVIENVQRDVNIALINEFALIFNRLGIDTEDVLLAAGSKWNFMPFRPGLVGGHCIGVDPYYLTYKAQVIGYHPEIILAGRRINDGMPAYVATQLVKGMANHDIQLSRAKVLILGFTFKENCPDIRNTKIIDIVKELGSYNCDVDVFDPWVKSADVIAEYKITPVRDLESGTYDAIILAVGHKEFRSMGAVAIRKLGKPRHIFYDLKSIFDKECSDIRL